MSEPHTSAVYHLAHPDRFPPGRLVHIEARPGTTVTDIYLHRRHVIGSLVWELNWLSRHHVGCGLWRQGRAPAPGARPVEVREVRWEIIPSDAMPSSRHVMSVEESDICVWLIRSGCCTTDLRDAMNKTIEHVAGMRQGWPDSREARRLPVSRPRIGGPVVPTPL